jgi:hypothetical protein
MGSAAFFPDSVLDKVQQAPNGERIDHPAGKPRRVGRNAHFNPKRPLVDR